MVDRNIMPLLAQTPYGSQADKVSTANHKNTHQSFLSLVVFFDATLTLHRSWHGWQSLFYAYSIGTVPICYKRAARLYTAACVLGIPMERNSNVSRRGSGTRNQNGSPIASRCCCHLFI